MTTCPELQLSALLTKYADDFKSNPNSLRNSIPAKHIWYYFIEEPKLGHVWENFETKESGYLLNLVNAFHLIFNVKKELDLTFIKQLHLKATYSVPNTNHDLVRPLSYKGEFRFSKIVSFGLRTENCSPAGLKELFDTPEDSIETYKLQIVHQSIPPNSNKNLIEHLSDELISRRRILLFSSIISNTPTEINHCINEIMQKIINTYHTKINTASKPIDKLRIIVSFIRDCVQLHPFADANCRTFVMLLFNFLLLKNGFPFALLKDPNNFGCYPIDELVQASIEGMQRTFSLASGDLLKKLLPIHGFEEDLTFCQARYMKKVITAEENNRKQLVYKETPHKAIVSPSLVSWAFKQVGFFAAGTAVTVAVTLFLCRLQQRELLVLCWRVISCRL